MNFYVSAQQLKSIPDPRHPPPPHPTKKKKTKRHVRSQGPHVFTLSAPHVILTLKFTG